MSKTIITIFVIIIVAGLGYWIYQSISSPGEKTAVSEGSKDCVSDEDCVVFGKTGDCNCGCYNKNNLPSETGGECFCLAPTSCKCVEGKCEGVFEEEISSFEECIAKGYPVLESYPRQCKTPDGETFVEDIGNELEKQDLIRVSKPRPNELIKSPLEIKGEARGYWFFEGDFPVILTDWDGRIIAEHYATAQGEWMTEDFVPFEGLLEFEKPKIIGEFAKRGTLIFQKDNPSGLPEHDDALEFTIFFE